MEIATACKLGAERESILWMLDGFVMDSLCDGIVPQSIRATRNRAFGIQPAGSARLHDDDDGGIIDGVFDHYGHALSRDQHSARNLNN